MAFTNKVPDRSIRVSFYDTDGVRVDNVTKEQASVVNKNLVEFWGKKEVFYFQDKNGLQRELSLEEVLKLKPENDLISDTALTNLGCPISPQPCGPPKVQFFGGEGVGAMANAVISPISSGVMAFDIVDAGKKYKKPPNAVLIDECGKGSGSSLQVIMKPTGKKDVISGKDILEVENIYIPAQGDGYLNNFDGSLGGNERTWKEAYEGHVITKEGNYYTVPDDREPPNLEPEDTWFPPGSGVPGEKRPTATFISNKTLVNSGEEVTLTWTSFNTTSVNISGIGKVDLNGSIIVTPNQRTEYILTATGPGGSITLQINIFIKTPPPPGPITPPQIDFVSSKYRIIYGENVELYWAVYNADEIFIDNSIGIISPFGSTTVSPSQLTTYTLTAKGPGGVSSESLTISVQYRPTPPPLPPVDSGGGGGLTPPTYKVIVCLDGVVIEDSGFGYKPGDTIKIIPDNGSEIKPIINSRGEIAKVEVVTKGCGFLDLPKIIVDSDTGFNALIKPILSVRRVTEEELLQIPDEVSIISVVDCVGKIAPKDTFDIIPR